MEHLRSPRGYSYLVAGAGAQGRAVAITLLQIAKAENITLVDPSEEARISARKFLSQVVGDLDEAGINILPLKEILPKLNKDLRYDAIISCAPHKANLPLTGLALKVGMPYFDLGGNGDVVSEQERLVQEFKSRSLVVPDCGLAPGISSILATHLRVEHGCKDIKIFCGVNPAKRPDPRVNPFQYWWGLFSPEGLASEYANMTTIITPEGVNGSRLGEIKALSRIEDLGLFDAAPTANNSVYTARFLKKLGVRRYGYLTLRYPGHFSAILGSKTSVEEYQVLKLIEENPQFFFNRESDRDLVNLWAVGAKEVGSRSLTPGNAEHCIRYSCGFDEKTGLSAMEKATALGVVLVVYRVVRESLAENLSGFHLPEEFMDRDWFLERLNEHMSL